MSNIYVMILEDRHTDVQVELFSSLDEAITRSKSIAKERDHHGDYEESELDGWEFYATYSCEGDSVRVVRRELNE